jgi:hypothetical protein
VSRLSSPAFLGGLSELADGGRAVGGLQGDQRGRELPIDNKRSRETSSEPGVGAKKGVVRFSCAPPEPRIWPVETGAPLKTFGGPLWFNSLGR